MFLIQYTWQLVDNNDTLTVLLIRAVCYVRRNCVLDVMFIVLHVAKLLVE